MTGRSLRSIRSGVAASARRHCRRLAGRWFASSIVRRPAPDPVEPELVPIRSSRRSPARGTLARLSAVSALGTALVCVATGGGADAREARCFTTRDGSFPCDFRMTDPDGSFQISALGKTTYILIMSEKDVAFGFIGLDTGNTALPGRYLRSTTEPGCWENDATPTKICAQ